MSNDSGSRNGNGNGNGNGHRPWIKDEVSARSRGWEEFYRNRWQHDKVVRSTHGVNCTGSCTWQIYVKDGIVTWEMQGLDYPLLEDGIPPYEPRGCQRGISFSWYLYSPLRVKYPYIRGALLDLWKEARSAHEDPVDAWRALMSDPKKRARYQRARGKGGLRRTSWATVKEIIAASAVYTIQSHGPDRIVGFSPIPAMSMLSYAAGSRMLQLMGGVNLSFYDWYCDLPSASPETWGEQTDVNESADWFHSKFLAVMGSNLNMTRTPDVHFACEARTNGEHLVADHFASRAQQIGVPGAGESDGLRELIGISRRKARSALLMDDRRDPESRLFDEVALDLIHEGRALPRPQPCRRTDARYLADPLAEEQVGPIAAESAVGHQLGRPHAADLVELLSRSHAADQVVQSCLGVQRSIAVRCSGEGFGHDE